jgi:hypothetical protein
MQLPSALPNQPLQPYQRPIRGVFFDKGLLHLLRKPMFTGLWDPTI